MKITIEGKIPAGLNITRTRLKAAAEYFAERSSARIGVPFRDVTVILQDDVFSAEVHEAVNGVAGPTDAITQPYDPMPGEDSGIYGEVYVNCERALSAAPVREGWSPEKELLLYIAHGMDHLSGAGDLLPADRRRMRRRELGWIRELCSRQDIRCL